MRGFFLLWCHERRTVVNQEIKVIADVQLIKNKCLFVTSSLLWDEGIQEGVKIKNRIAVGKIKLPRMIIANAKMRFSRNINPTKKFLNL